MKSKAISVLLSLVLMVSCFTNAGIMHASAAVNTPQLLITEVMPKSLDNDDPYEYIELYNTSDIYIDLKNYKFINPNIDITASNVIPPKGTMVICMRSNTSLYDFNKFYGTNLTANDYMTLPNTANALDDSSQSIWLVKDDGMVVSTAKYEAQDFDLKKTVIYKYPESGFEMIILGQKQSPTPGNVTIDQIPDYGTRVAGITLDKTSATMEIGNAIVLTATITPSTATNKGVVWRSSNTNVAVVNANGIVTAKAYGTAVITATSAENSDISANCIIVVSKVPVTGITLDKTSASICANQVIILKATVLPETATNKQVIWKSSNTAAATVDNNGIVLGKNAGTTTITARTVDGNYTASCNVTVYSSDGYIHVTGVHLDKNQMKVEPGRAFVLTATVSPNNATNKGIIWRSSNTNIASVDNNGIVLAKAVGTATITAASVEGVYSASCKVTVTTTPISEVPVTGIKIDKLALIMQLQETNTLKATVLPTNATNKGITWNSSNPSCVSVDQTGKLNALKEGIAIITVSTEEGNYTAKCIVVVINCNNNNDDSYKHPIVSIKMNKTALKLKDHQRYTLKVIATPGVGRLKQLKWTSSNTSVAIVDSNGTVTPRGEGTAVITALTSDGKLSCKCTVTVYMSKSKGHGKK